MYSCQVKKALSAVKDSNDETFVRYFVILFKPEKSTHLLKVTLFSIWPG